MQNTARQGFHDMSLPYEEVTDGQFAIDAASSFRFIAASGRRRGDIEGPCPRCAGHMVESLIAGGYRGAERGHAPAPDRDSESDETLVCLCDADHPGRPADRPRGCGAYWNLKIIRERPA
ncbi:hypothetical protein [Streptomyces sp. NPDC059176]|uniref:hypothetical protein n=1 Tax=Streptomyces sp. NPDC059176 TaxID=3346758 RepID=UPI00367B4D56